MEKYYTVKQMLLSMKRSILYCSYLSKIDTILLLSIMHGDAVFSLNLRHFFTWVSESEALLHLKLWSWLTPGSFPSLSSSQSGIPTELGFPFLSLFSSVPRWPQAGKPRLNLLSASASRLRPQSYNPAVFVTCGVNSLFTLDSSLRLWNFPKH